MEKLVTEGKVDIFELPLDMIHVKLDESYLNLIFETIKSNFSTVNNFARKLDLKISKNNCCEIIRSAKKGSYISLKLILNMFSLLKNIKPSLFNKDILRKNIIGVKSKNGKPILNPKFPMNFNCKAGGIIFGAMVGDGGFCVRDLNIFYSNTKNKLLKRVNHSVEQVMGSVNLATGKKHEINYPKICGLILLTLGFVPGRKTIKNPKFPEFIHNSSFEFKKGFISQILADESYVYLSKNKKQASNIHINFTIDLTAYPENLRLKNRKNKQFVPETLLVFIKVLKSLGVNVRGPYFKKAWYYTSGRYTEEWSANIFDLKSLKFVFESLEIPLEYKQETLGKIIKIKEKKK